MLGRCRSTALLAVAIAVSACSPGPSPAPSSPPGSASASVLATPTPTATTPTASAPTGALEPRPGLPALIDGEAAACIPDCGVGRVAGGAMPNGRYQTRWFFDGSMTLGTDDAWSLREDSNGELAIFLPGDTEYGMAFWLDPEPYRHGQRVSGLGNDARAVLDWLAANPDLEVSTEQPASIGDVPATSVDIGLARTAGQDEVDCGSDPCISFINNHAFDHVGGILGDDVYRFLFADVSYAGTDHVLAVIVEGRDQSHLDSIRPTVDELLSTVTIPARPG